VGDALAGVDPELLRAKRVAVDGERISQLQSGASGK
jgi:hypothetical protein